MNKILLSVIVNTYPPKAKYLKNTIEGLLNQTFNFFEVIIINDGFDKETEEIVNTYSKNIPITYNYRKNDAYVSRSRNIGAKLANANNLVFIDNDIILNPYALETYYNHLKDEKNLSLWGKYGNLKDEFSEVTCENILDDRLVFFVNDEAKEYLENFNDYSPFALKVFFVATSANFAISKELFLKAGGFNEAYRGWGHEDINFGYKLYKQSAKFKFIKESWGVHLPHERKGLFYDKKLISKNEKRLNLFLGEEYSKYLLLDDDLIIKEHEKLISLDPRIEDISNKILINYLLQKKSTEKIDNYCQKHKIKWKLIINDENFEDVLIEKL